MIRISRSRADMVLAEAAAVLVPGAGITLSAVLDADGLSPTWSEVSSVNASLCGVEWFAQSAVVSPAAPGGVAVTDALRFRVGPAGPIEVQATKLEAGFTNDVELGDLNGDGILDIAVTMSGVAVWLGMGDGSFGELFHYVDSEVTGIFELALGDLNGDGRDDVVTSNIQADNVSVFLAREDGSLEDPVHYATSAYPETPVTGDWNEDGHLDVAVVHFGSQELVILLGDGTGSLDYGPERYLAGSGPFDLASADLDNDGHLDLVVADAGLTVFLGRGDGRFTPLPTYTEAGGYTMEPADLDGDGNVDLVGPSGAIGGSAVLLGLGDGTFRQIGAVPTEGLAESTAIGDLDGDGDLDLAFSHFAIDGVRVFTGDGTGAFEPGPMFPGSAQSRSIAGGDLDGNGTYDLVSCGEGGVHVLLNRLGEE